MRFRPCIDLRNGEVVQIVGGTLVDGGEPITNFVAQESPASFARRYQADGLAGGHVIALGAWATAGPSGTLRRTFAALGSVK